jgi:hypothetical protein
MEGGTQSFPGESPQLCRWKNLALTPALSPRRESDRRPRWEESRISEHSAGRKRFSLSLWERAGVRVPGKFNRVHTVKAGLPGVRSSGQRWRAGLFL